jgi:hypothetical protein
MCFFNFICYKKSNDKGHPMNRFLQKYNVTEVIKGVKSTHNALSPEEKNKQKMLMAISEQLLFLQKLSNGHVLQVQKGGKIQTPRLFWQDSLGGFLFTPRFGNDFLFGKDRGISCSSYEELQNLLNDFQKAVENDEFQDRISEIASTRKGRGAGVSRNRN